MPAKKEQRDYVNPKLLLRGVMKSLPAVEYVRATVVALWAHSNNFLEKDDVADGTVSFNGTISYGQLADFCGIDYETAKWRMKQLRDKHELVEWERFKLGIRFTFGVRLLGNGLTAVMDYLSDNSSQVTEDSSQVMKRSSQVMDGLESGNGLPPLAFDLALSGEELSGLCEQDTSLRSEEQEQEQHPEPRQIDEDDYPGVPVHPPSPQAIAVPPAAPPPDTRPRCKDNYCRRVLQTETEIRRGKCDECLEWQRQENRKWVHPRDTHDWSKDKNVCDRCGTTREELKYENIYCAAPQAKAAVAPSEGQD
jgi:hypothetical protein